MTDCCAQMREARNRKIVLPRYYSPDEDTCKFEGLQFWSQDTLAGTRRARGMLLRFCPFCGADISVKLPVPDRIREESG